MKPPLDQKAKTRARIAFLFLFVFVIALSVGAYFLTNLGTLRESIAARERQTALQGITDAKQIDEALRRHPSNRILQMIARATKAANETDVAVETLSNEIEPPALAKEINLAKASRSDLEALRRDLKVAEANATALMPRYAALIKAERDQLEAYALSLRADKDTVGRFLDGVDRRHAEAAALTSKLLSARADYYHAYESYVAVLAGEFGTYEVVAGKFIFPLQRTVDRYNVAANAMAAAAQRVAELQEERTKLMQSQQDGWEQFVNGQ
jgi:hypothetical protein